MTITVMNHVTLDGVMQGPGRKDEDPRGGFAHGGWAQEGNDEVMGQFMGERMAQGGSLLFGRRTYEDVLSYWNSQPDNPFASMLNSQQKYVASTTLQEPLRWPNSTLLQGDAADAVATLKADQPDGQLTIMGSRSLIHALMTRHLVDEWLLMIHPVVLGSGLRLFDDGVQATRMELVDAITTTTGVIIATYRSASDNRS
ncbi:MAG TPA: dihydrofolate reductase family protein [Nitriliruptorales bacterium]|nr:dihydrofolate reductase family protein [Nitriliruptorales bacterium]